MGDDTLAGAAAQAVSQAGPAPAPAPAPAAPPKADRGKWLTGDLEGMKDGLADRLAALGERLGKPIRIASGHRTYQEQADLYAKYLAGKGNLAAKPGESNHESGNAADAYIGGTALRDNAEAKRIALELGLKFTVASESWHVEVA